MIVLMFLVLIQEIIFVKIILNGLNVFNVSGDDYLKIASYNKHTDLKNTVVSVVLFGIYFYNIRIKWNTICIVIIILFFILFIVTDIVHRNKVGFITSKGFWNLKGFFYWKFIKDYKWIKENCIELYGVSRFGFDISYRIENIIIPKEKLDRIIQENIK